MNGRTLPLYALPISFALFVSIFPDRIHFWWSLLAAAVLFLAAMRVGKHVFGCCVEQQSFYYPLGLGILLISSYILFLFTANRTAVTLLWCIFAVLAVQNVSFLLIRIPFKLLCGAPFLLLGFWSCVTPATFFDALVYHLGLPQQYLLAGKMQVMPHHLYSSFPPLEQVLNLLFAGIQAEAGIKMFTLFILFGALYCAYSFLVSQHQDEAVLPEQLFLPVLCIPTVWILIHLVTGDLLTALFLSSGVFLLLISGKRLSVMASAAVLIAFACWTKSNVLLYLPFLILFFGLNWRRAFAFAAIIVLLIAPLFLRNYVVMGDPLYPMLSTKLSNPHWSIPQEQALQRDSFPSRARTLKGLGISISDLITNRGDFGSGSEIGFVPLVAAIIFLITLLLRGGFAYRRLLLYIALCFLAWLYVFPNFRQFFPVFLLLVPLFYISWAAMKRKSFLFNVAVTVFCALGALYLLLPFYRDLFPLLSFTQSRQQYLRANVAYYPVAEALKKGRAILIGETRTAYYQVPVIASTAYDRSTFVDVLKSSGSAEAFFNRLREMGITHVVYNRQQFQSYSQKYGLWTFSQKDQQLLQEFVQRYTLPRLRVNGIYLLELR